jgi:ATP-binding protein involved in chromosome partitioning
MVKEMNIADSRITLDIEYKIPATHIREGVEADIRSALAGEAANLVVRSSVEIPSMPSSQKEEVLPMVGNTLAVASGKGGVGKSTVAVNLAVALAHSGARVGLLDADIYGPSIPMMMGITEQPGAYRENDRTVLVPVDNHGVKVMSIGMLIDKDDAMIWRGPMASSAFRQLLTEVDWGALDYLIFDLPPGTGDIQLTLSQLLPLNGAIVVTTPQDIALADARKGVRMFERVNVPIFGLVENMSFYVCSHCGNREEIFRTGGGRKAAEELGVPLLSEIPIISGICAAGDSGIPMAVLEPDGPVGLIYRELALNVAGAITRSMITGKGVSPVIDLGQGV